MRATGQDFSPNVSAKTMVGELNNSNFVRQNLFSWRVALCLSVSKLPKSPWEDSWLQGEKFCARRQGFSLNPSAKSDR